MSATPCTTKASTLAQLQIDVLSNAALNGSQGYAGSQKLLLEVADRIQAAIDNQKADPQERAP